MILNTNTFVPDSYLVLITITITTLELKSFNKIAFTFTFVFTFTFTFVFKHRFVSFATYPGQYNVQASRVSESFEEETILTARKNITKNTSF